MSSDFQVVGTNDAAPFTLKVHRGEGMALLAMNWKGRRPSDDFVGFAIQYRLRGQRTWLDVHNRIGFPKADGSVQQGSLPSRQAPIQKFRWVHFPGATTFAGAELTYRVRPVFMDERDTLTLGEAQQAKVDLGGETHPGLLNVAFTRGFVASQAFVDRYAAGGDISTLLPETAAKGLAFQPTHAKADEAYGWMGFEARHAIVTVLDEALADPQAQVRVIAYDLNLPELVTRLEQLGDRVRIIIDDSDAHGERGSAENAAAARLVKSAGRARVKRQSMGKLQHNKMIVVDGPATRAVVWGSTNFSWRGFYVQSNNALIVRGASAVALGAAAFDTYWEHDDPSGFAKTAATKLTPLGLTGVNAQVAFSPHGTDTAQLADVGTDIAAAKSSVLYSMAFLAQTGGPVREALTQVTNDDKIFVYGISDRKAGGISLHPATGNPAPVFSTALTGKDLPEPFKAEETGGSGNRMHHKFAVIDFDKPTARVWTGSYNFSSPADKSNGENLLIIKDRRVATSYMVEALRIFDHYRFRVAASAPGAKRGKLSLRRPPRAPGELPWFDKDYTVAMKVRDRKLFS